MSGKRVTLYEYGKPVFYGNVRGTVTKPVVNPVSDGTVTKPVVNPLSDDTVTKPVVEHVGDNGIVAKHVVEPVKASVMFRVVIQTRGYPNGKLESREEKFFANLEDAKAYARGKDYETPVSTTRAFVQAIIGFDVFTLCESLATVLK